MPATDFDNLKNKSAQTKLLPVAKLVLPPLPKNIVKVVPEMEAWERAAAANIDDFVRKLNTVVAQ